MLKCLENERSILLEFQKVKQLTNKFTKKTLFYDLCLKQHIKYCADLQGTDFEKVDKSFCELFNAFVT